jgi:Tfp pilus assembly PilM family ATPase
MARLLALEWDDAEARVAVADAHRDGMVLEQAFSITMPSGVPTHITADSPISASGAHDLGAIGKTIGDALARRGIKRGKTLVAVGRTNIELKNLTLPPAPAEELPEMVRFQAEREFNTLEDDWPLDYIPIPGRPGEAQTVMAAAISPDLVGEIQVTCQAAGLVPQRLVLRPCAAASLLSRTKPGSRGKLRLLVDLVSEEADLTILDGDTVVFLRTTRLQKELLQNDPPKALLPEIRRTIAAVQNRFKGQRVEEIFLCGEGANQGNLALEIGKDLDLPTEVFNPLTACAISSELRRSMPDHPSRFAPLVGMLLDEAVGGAQTIDFLNPRRRPQARSWKKEATIAGAIAAALVVLLGGWIWLQLRSKDSEIADLQQTLQTLTPQATKAKDTIAKASKIENWLGGEIVWVDELAGLATNLPPAKDVMLSQINIAQDGRKKPTMKLNGFARGSEVRSQVQQKLSDGRHDVIAPTATQDQTHKSYPLKFEADVEIHPDDSGAKAKPAARPAGPSAAKSAANNKSAAIAEEAAK